MKRSTVIATCLTNSRLFGTLEDAESQVRLTFSREHPGKDFDTWNREMTEDNAKAIVMQRSKASSIDVAAFIEELSSHGNHP